MEIILGWVLTMSCIGVIVWLHKDYVPLGVAGVVVGALLLQGAL
uniref:Uncharacterized protein n=2 Tax=unclassified bacterial viruses TaxID=12333 RepID=A0AAU6VZJ2_9VIRU